MNNKSIVFFGTPEFAVASLSAIYDNKFNIKAVVTTPDKPAGRGKKIAFSSVKIFALEKNLHLLQPENLSDSNFISELLKINADLFVVVAFRKLPNIVWQMPRLGTFNLHASLLPNYRGAAPINWTIINGEKETGVTTFFLNEKIDEGKIIFNQKIAIENNETFGELYNRMKFIGSELLIKTIDAIFDNKIVLIDQKSIIDNTIKMKIAPKINKSDCKISWNDTANNIVNKVRGLNPIPAAFSTFNIHNETEINVKVYDARLEIKNHSFGIGEILTDNKTFFKISVLDGFVFLSEIQLPGKNKVKIEDFLRGNKKISNWKTI